ncbi:MAG: cytochrome B, partial [Gammaproteobacteria bacterium]|nr:cytochrome B [Gammaproteobacteria bacterium]
MQDRQNTNEIELWDIFIRVFYWSLVFTFLVAYVTKGQFEFLHVNAGYFILFLLGIRIFYALIGPRSPALNKLVAQASPIS